MKGNRFGQVGRAAGLVALGAAAGSAAALLFAPASGKVTRKRIANKMRNMGRSTTRQLNQTKKLLARRAGAIRSAATERLEDTKEWLLERVSNSNGKHHLPRRAHR